MKRPVKANTSVTRSENMRRIGSKNTSPELLVRRLVHRLGFRFRLHRKELPGKPDLVFVASRKVIFVHGCFWHQHGGCVDSHLPKSNRNYWLPKLARNQVRDRVAQRELRKLGWRSMTVWECQLKKPDCVEAKLWRFLKNGS